MPPPGGPRPAAATPQALPLVHFGNSKYWWRRVGAHPVLRQLVRQAPALGYAYADPFAFVDHCERARGSGSEDERLAEEVQGLEWQLLFDWCYQRAIDAA